MRVRLIVNPSSGMDRAMELLPKINQRLCALARDVDITVTTEAGDSERAAARAPHEGYEAVYVAGGDGTVNAVVRGLMSVPGGLSIPVGIVPCGTGNDFSKALGLGEEPEAALELLLDTRVLDVDVGMINDRPFVNTSAGGFVADVSEVVTETLKDRAGKLAYLIGGARALLGSESFSARFAAGDVTGTTVAAWPDDQQLQMFAVCNAPMIGGGYPIAPDALIDDGRLEVLMVAEMPLLDFVAALQQIAAGESTTDERVYRFRASAFDLRFSRTVRVNTDGELFHADHCHYRVLHRGARFFCGPEPRAAGEPRLLTR